MQAQMNQSHVYYSKWLHKAVQLFKRNSWFFSFQRKWYTTISYSTLCKLNSLMRQTGEWRKPSKSGHHPLHPIYLMFSSRQSDLIYENKIGKMGAPRRIHKLLHLQFMGWVFFSKLIKHRATHLKFNWSEIRIQKQVWSCQTEKIPTKH